LVKRSVLIRSLLAIITKAYICGYANYIGVVCERIIAVYYTCGPSNSVLGACICGSKAPQV